MINKLVETLAAAGRRAFSRLWRHQRLRPALSWVRRHLPETVAVAGIVSLVLVVNPAKLAAAFGRMDWRIALVMMPVAVTSYLLRGLAWWVALRRLAVRLTLRHTLAVELAGQVMVSLPLGDLSRVAMVRKLWKGRGARNLTGSIAFQELTFTLLLGLGILPRVFAKPDIALLLVAMTAAHVGVFTVIAWKPAYEWALARVERIRMLRRFDRQLRAVRPAVIALFDWRALIPIVLCQAVAVLLSYLLFNLGLHSLGIQIP
ncbi:MAG: flippase-like domain-containing protein, partial [Candidatus Dormibacteraeota bacterium]|nr:flippase-like domain-containing protein [Candidatus Dormibacteraeota bacterium]